MASRGKFLVLGFALASTGCATQSATPSEEAMTPAPVAIAEEAVTLRDRQGVEATLLFQAHHGGHEGDQRASRKVEVRDQRPDVLPLVRRPDEDVGFGADR